MAGLVGGHRLEVGLRTGGAGSLAQSGRHVER